MDNLCKQPFLLSLKEAAKQTGGFPVYETLLQEHQSAFQDYLYESCQSNIPAPKRYYFLKNADYQLSRLRLMYGDKIKKRDVDFFRFWSMLIMDTRWYINIGVETLKFQADCPAHMLTEPSQTFPAYRWTASRNDLTEAITGFFQADVIRLHDGSRTSFVPFAKSIGNFFGITYSNPHEEMRKILNRKKHQTPFFSRIIERLKGKIDDEDR
jgi:hypothetical protein